MEDGALATESATQNPKLKTQNSKLKTKEWAWAALGCALLATLWLSPVLLTGRVLSPADLLLDWAPWAAQRPAGWPGSTNALFSDAVVQFEPWLAYTGARLWGGSLPLWNPDNYLGAPFLANMQSAVFFPPNWPAFLWPGAATLALRIWLKLALATLGMYVLAREVARVRPLAAALAVLPFVGGSFMAVWLFHPQTATVIWLPWVWWATARLLDQPGPRWVAVLAAFVALTLFAGHPETAFHIAEATGCFVLFRIWQSGPLRPARVARLLAVWGAAYGLGAAVAAIQLLPFLEYSAQSIAQVRRLDRAGTPWSVPFYFAWSAISPDLFGNPAQRNFWAPLGYTGTNNFCGVLPLLLAPLAPLVRNRGQRTFAAFLLALTLLAGAVVYGLPGVFDLVMSIPGQRLVLNDRLILVVEFGLGLLAALGVEALCARAVEWRARLLAVLGGVSLFWLVVGVAVPALLAGPVFALPADSPVAVGAWQAGLWRAAGGILAGSALLAAILALWTARPRLASAGLLLLPALLLADLWQAHGVLVPAVAPTAYYPTPQAVAYLHQQAGRFRIAAASEVLPSETNLAYGLSDLRGYDGLEPLPYYQLVFLPALKQNTGPIMHPSPLLNLLGVRYVLASTADALPAQTAAGAPWFVPVYDGGPGAPSVYENRQALPRAWLAHRAAVQPDSAAGITRLAGPGFDYAGTILLDAPLSSADALPAAPPPAAADGVTITTYLPEQVQIATASPAAGILVLSDMAFPGWQTRVDGAPVPILPVDHALRGVYLPAGRHTVVFAYAPDSFKWGAALSGAALLLVVALVLWPRRRGRLTSPGT